MAIAAAASQEPGEGSKRETIRFTAVCGGCGRKVTRRSRKGMTWRCECGRTNPGPALVAEMAKPPEAGAVRRRRRRAAAAERVAAEGTPAAAVPVRRKRTPPAAASTDAQPGNEAKGEGTSPRGRPAVGAPPAAPRRGLLERVIDGLVYGGPDDGE